MKRVAFAMLVIVTGVAHAQPAPLDPSALPTHGHVGLAGEPREPAPDEAPEVTLMTFGVGDVIFEKFGHAALCLDYHGGDPVCFNYGVTDFNAGSDLAWNFLRTQQRFWVEPESFDAMTSFYKWEDRDIWMQVLPLTPDQARKVEHKLTFDIREANRYYVYDHFFDNCTTRLRNIIDDVTDGKLRGGTEQRYPLTYREIALRGFAEIPLAVALTDFVFGRQLDDTPTIWEAMFHPSVLREQVATQLGVKPRSLYMRRGPPFPANGRTDRILTIGLALLFALPLLVATWRRRLERAALVWATVYLTLWGLVIWSLVGLSSISGIRWNEAVFVLMPLDLALPLLSIARRRIYARVRLVGLLVVSVLCAIGVFHQPLWVPILTAILPLAIIAFDLPHPWIRPRLANAS